MKTNTALLWIGLFTLTGAVTIACGGSSDNGSLFTAGTAGNIAGTTSATAGMTSTGGTISNTAGSNNNTAGSNNNTAGSNNNTAGSNNTAGNNNNAGGSFDPGTGGAPDPGVGGASTDGCPATMPTQGAMCMQGDSPFEGCNYGDMNCRCRRANGGQMRAWQCEAAQGADAVCPADAMDGDPCTGQGRCAGQQCFCNNQETNCF